MQSGRSYYGPLRDSRDVFRETYRPAKGRKPWFAFTILVVAILVSTFSFAWVLGDGDKGSKTLSVVTTPITLVYQHFDTSMFCLPCAAVGPHWWNHAKGVDGIYGTVDDCPHCSCYCAPASISMIALYRGFTSPITDQDIIYDSAEMEAGAGEIMGNFNIERHGVGMCDGTSATPIEVQTAFIAAVGAYVQHDHSGSFSPPLTPSQLQQYITTQHPVLWLDHNGWPVNQSASYPSSEYRSDQGHAKVIAGYDDKGTADFGDDLCLVYDPWPEYNDLGVLPFNTTKGPGGTFDPYWQPLNDVNLSDTTDIHIVDTYPDIPEFGNLLIPLVGILAISTVIVWRSRIHKGE